jgi:peptide deformylase
MKISQMKKIFTILFFFLYELTFSDGYVFDEESPLFPLWEESSDYSDFLFQNEESATLVDINATILSEYSESIETDQIQSEESNQIIQSLISVAKASGETHIAGLAAPQIGFSKRVILVDLNIDKKSSKKQNLKIYINPEIIWKSKEVEEKPEGCLSTGPVYGIIERSKSVIITAWNYCGDKIIEHHEGNVAKIFQHEIDHLNGVRFPDIITHLDHLHWVEDSDLLEYKTNWENWPKKCSKARWNHIKKYGIQKP